MNTLLQALYFIIPAYIANMMPVFFKCLPWFATPISNRLFGSHKTYRGFFAGIAGGMTTVFIQKWLAPTTATLTLMNYASYSTSKLALLGFLFGFGALAGDLIKSFLKRRIGIEPGGLWFPFDQLDSVVGALIAVSIMYTPPLLHIVVIIAVSPLLSFITTGIGYIIGLRKVWW